MAHRAKQEADLRGWPDSKNADRFVALAKEQLALIADAGRMFFLWVDGVNSAAVSLALLIHRDEATPVGLFHRLNASMLKVA